MLRESYRQRMPLSGTDRAATDTSDTSDGTIGHWLRCIFRYPYMELWNAHPLHCDRLYPKSARLKEKQDALWQFHVHLCDRREVTLKES